MVRHSPTMFICVPFAALSFRDERFICDRSAKCLGNRMTSDPVSIKPGITFLSQFYFDEVRVPSSTHVRMSTSPLTSSEIEPFARILLLSTTGLSFQCFNIRLRQRHLGLRRRHLGLRQRHLGLRRRHPVGLHQRHLGLHQRHPMGCTNGTSGCTDGTQVGGGNFCMNSIHSRLTLESLRGFCAVRHSSF